MTCPLLSVSAFAATISSAVEYFSVLDGVKSKFVFVIVTVLPAM